MLTAKSSFDRSIERQLAINRSRTPTERFLALCDLLDFVRATVPNDPASRERRLRAQSIRREERERLREQWRQIIAAQRFSHPESL